MIILKFGGSSVGSPKGMDNVYKIASSYNEPVLVVLSALSGTTNDLELLNKGIEGNCTQENNSILDKLDIRYNNFIEGLFSTVYYKNEALKLKSNLFEQIKIAVDGKMNGPNSYELLSFGELLSTNLFFLYTKEKQTDSCLIAALDFMRIDKSNEPDYFYIKQSLKQVLSKTTSNIYITQGFICRNVNGEIENLRRGGSDFTATILGNVLQSKHVEIWTDIDGMHNNDPRFVENTKSIKFLDYDEASELAYFGAKILHPACVFPVKELNIPLLLKNTMEPLSLGTRISNIREDNSITAVAAKDGIVAIKIKSVRMLNAYGFLSQVFEIFKRYKTPIDMITTSEVAISLTIDNPMFLNEIVQDLVEYGDVSFQLEQSIICVVGDFSEDKTSSAHHIFTALKEIPIRMISYGGSKRNVSILVETKFKTEALNALQNSLFLN